MKIASECRITSSLSTRWHRLFRGAVLTMAYALAIPIASAATAQTVMIYGDSLSAAYGLDPNDGWVSLLQVRLKPEGIIVVNSSISGETTRGGLSRISTDLAKIKPNVVVLALGANDGLRGLPIADTKESAIDD